MKQIITIITSVLLFGCNNNQRTIAKLENEHYKNEWDYKKVSKTYIDSFITQICSSGNIEIIDLYPILDTIASDSFENLILVDILKSKGFTVKDWGRGNWQEGPRIVSYKMTKLKCDCQIDKLYYSTEKNNKFKVTERIKCNPNH